MTYSSLLLRSQSGQFELDCCQERERTERKKGKGENEINDLSFIVTSVICIQASFRSAIIINTSTKGRNGRDLENSLNTYDYSKVVGHIMDDLVNF